MGNSSRDLVEISVNRLSSRAGTVVIYEFEDPAKEKVSDTGYRSKVQFVRPS